MWWSFQLLKADLNSSIYDHLKAVISVWLGLSFHHTWANLGVVNKTGIK